jgi:hypothetical protein
MPAISFKTHRIFCRFSQARRLDRLEASTSSKSFCNSSGIIEMSASVRKNTKLVKIEGSTFPCYTLTIFISSSCFGANPPLTFTKRLMNNYIPLILTTAVTISTIIYTFYSIQLWRTTHTAAKISRQAALGNLWSELNRYLEILRQQDAPETAFIQKLSDLFLEFMIANLLTSALEKNDPNLEELRRKISALVSENEAHASKIPWVARIVEPKRRH